MTAASGKILLSGASGMIGSALQRAIAIRNRPVLRLVRRPADSSAEFQWSPATNPSITDPVPLEHLAAAIHLSGSNVAAHRWTPAFKRELAESRVQSTRALATTLADLSKPPEALLVASATGIYGNRADEFLDETSLPGSGFLADLCQQWEAAAQPAVDAGIRVIHLRFGVVIGPGSGALARLLPIFRIGLGGRLGSGRQWMSWISLDDTVAAILFALQTPSLAGPINITAPQPVTNAEFTCALASAVHRPAVFPVPSFALRLALGEMANESLLSSARTFPAKLTNAGFRFTFPSIAEAIAAVVAPPPPDKPA